MRSHRIDVLMLDGGAAARKLTRLREWADRAGQGTVAEAAYREAVLRAEADPAAFARFAEREEQQRDGA
jgi:hypothetical protein